MGRAYLRLDPSFFERKAFEQGYPPAAVAALIGVFCLAEHQPERGRFRNERVLKALLDDYAKQIPFLKSHGDLEILDDGRVYPPGWDEWQEGDWRVGERVARIRGRRGGPVQEGTAATVTPDTAATVTPTVTPTVTDETAGRTAKSIAVHSGKNEQVPSNGVYPAPSAGEPLLTKRELKAWHPYRRDQWAAFKAAWLARGFRLPPAGDPDDPRSQAHVLWEILDNRGDELAAWVAAAPGKTSHAIVAHVIERWQAIKAEAGIDDEPAPDVERDPTSTPESARSILARLAGEEPAWTRPPEAKP